MDTKATHASRASLCIPSTMLSHSGSECIRAASSRMPAEVGGAISPHHSHRHTPKSSSDTTCPRAPAAGGSHTICSASSWHGSTPSFRARIVSRCQHAGHWTVVLSATARPPWATELTQTPSQYTSQSWTTKYNGCNNYITYNANAHSNQYSVNHF